MSIAGSILKHLNPTPHVAAGGLLGALSRGGKAYVDLQKRSPGLAYRYSGAEDFVQGAVSGAKHPIRRLKGEDAPMRVFNGKLVPFMSGEVPMGPGGAAKGLLERQALKLATPERLAAQRGHVTSAGVHGENYGELDLGSPHPATAQRVSDIMRKHPKTVVHKVPENDRLGAATGSPRETFFIDKDGSIVMNPPGDWKGVHHPDLMAAHGLISKNWQGDGLPQHLVKSRNIVQGEINHVKASGGKEPDRLSLRGWGNTPMNAAQEKTMHEISDAALKQGINMRPPTPRGAVKPHPRGARYGFVDASERQGTGVAAPVGTRTSELIRRARAGRADRR